jgi:hypothetical protein
VVTFTRPGKSIPYEIYAIPADMHPPDGALPVKGRGSVTVKKTATGETATFRGATADGVRMEGSVDCRPKCDSARRAHASSRAPVDSLRPGASAAPAVAQAPSGRIPLGTGATMVQTLSAVGADRESMHQVRLASDSGLHYEWRLEEVHDNGDTVRHEYRYREGWADLEDSRRLRLFHDAKAPEAHPGYKLHALSRATYRRLRDGKPDSLQIMYVDQAPAAAPLRAFGFGGARAMPVRWRGTIVAVGAGTVPFPVLLNGRRVQLRALHLRGDFTARPGRWQPELWVLADTTYPLILKWIGDARESGNVLQTTRIDLPFLLVPVNGVAAGDGVLLVGREGLGAAKVAGAAAGGGAPDPAAIEGRAPNRRVELVRDCPGGKGA